MTIVRHRNVLIIHTDQQRYDSLGCTGIPHADTPNIDRLAREGSDQAERVQRLMAGDRSGEV